MSSLWTPGGEHPVDPKTGEHQPSEEPQSASVPDLESLSPEEQSQAEALAREMAAVREQLASTPAALVVANHLMGLYELAAIHLSADPPDLEQSVLAIDAVACLVEDWTFFLRAGPFRLRVRALHALQILPMPVVRLLSAKESMGCNRPHLGHSFVSPAS